MFRDLPMSLSYFENDAMSLRIFMLGQYKYIKYVWDYNEVQLKAGANEEMRDDVTYILVWNKFVIVLSIFWAPKYNPS